MSEAKAWTAAALLGGRPFSLLVDGKPWQGVPATSQQNETKDKLNGGQSRHTIVTTDPATGLSIRCEAVAFADFPTVEWTLYLKNTGKSDSPILSEIMPLDASFLAGDGEIALHHHTGDNCTPDSYQLHRLSLAPGKEHRLASVGGRPTTGSFPYFNLEGAGKGVIVAVGWPGQWEAKFLRDAKGVRVVAGQEKTHFRLRPGEEVRTPRIVVQFYRGDRAGAQNVWRRWMMAHNMPRPAGQLPPPMLSSCSGGFFPGLKCNEKDELLFIDTYVREKIPFTYWWMDAGWYPCGDAGWPKVGTWEVDRERFPRGLKAISERVHASGMKLILWFEPERVAADTWLTQKHPEWVLGREKGGLFNLGDPQARAWLIEHVDRLIVQEGIDLYRQDFNIDPLPFWRANDAPDRQGITEIRHVEGYLAYWDELRRRHPAMLIDSCASGGRRNDLETLRRAVPLLRSDYQSFEGDPAFALGNQCHTYALSAWIPFYGQGTYYNDRDLAYAVRSHFCPSFGLCWDVRKPGVDWNVFRRLTANWQRIAGDYAGDFYPLTPYSLDDSAWIAWQFHRPETGTGFVQAFRRRQNGQESMQLILGGLNPEARYRVENLDQPGATVATGRELSQSGLAVKLPARPDSAIFVYRVER
jgi:alpha-galactosidase